MKGSYDVHVHSTHSGGTSTLSEMIEMAHRLGHQNICLSDFGAIDRSQVESLLKECKGFNLNIHSRADISPKTPRELSQKLNYVRRKVDLVAVECSTENICRFASTNRFVDILTLAITAKAPVFTELVARNCSKNGIALEITLIPFIRYYGKVRAKLLRMWRKILSVALRNDVMFVIGTGAVNKYELRGSREMLLLAKLVGLPHDLAKQSLMEIPFKLTERRILERNGKTKMPGVRIIDEEKE
ncbi:MAG: RNase P subunit p30 family protein [Candidatus Sifarchaeia archaeon]|jgi:RNase P/RNase MRP subunit p30